MNHFKVIGLNEMIQKVGLLPVEIIYKLIYQLTLTLITIYQEQNFIENMTLNDLYVNEPQDNKILDIFIKSSLIKKGEKNNQEIILNQLKNILIRIGFQSIDVKSFQNFEAILKYILDNLKINLNDFSWRQKMLEIIYGLKITYCKEYNNNITWIFHAETPYYLDISSEKILVKWIHVNDQNKRFAEIINYKELKNIQQTFNSAQLYCYNLDIQNSTLMFLKKYSLTLKEYCTEFKDIIINIENKRRICCKLAIELQKLHDENKIHRDLKPENIMVIHKNSEITKENLNEINQLEWSIIDFESNIEKGQKDDFKGTPYYQPPENMNGKPFDESYDIWQLGMCFYFLMTQEDPNFIKKKTKEKYEKHLKKMLNKLTDSVLMHDIISDMAKYDSNLRPATREVINKLKSADFY
ncbi:unnamed protein product [Paramecium sonneborni]|uniref:Protein kinase domain-containing protein n=1 Tax=Paramecium sonneborni TaxID=65129 RepID=A0A8S1NSE7_9CILI|nr:unnamed protein product [Paramecium sonneborni]